MNQPINPKISKVLGFDIDHAKFENERALKLYSGMVGQIASALNARGLRAQARLENLGDGLSVGLGDLTLVFENYWTEGDDPKSLTAIEVYRNGRTINLMPDTAEDEGGAIVIPTNKDEIADLLKKLKEQGLISFDNNTTKAFGMTLKNWRFKTKEELRAYLDLLGHVVNALNGSCLRSKLTVEQSSNDILLGTCNQKTEKVFLFSLYPKWFGEDMTLVQAFNQNGLCSLSSNLFDGSERFVLIPTKFEAMREFFNSLII